MTKHILSFLGGLTKKNNLVLLFLHDIVTPVETNVESLYDQTVADIIVFLVRKTQDPQYELQMAF